jgi:betaine-aldehyde dehydrogenase
MAITDNATHALLIDEVFGPVLSVRSFHNDNEAFALANHTRSGLAGTVWINEHLAIGSPMPQAG